MIDAIKEITKGMLESGQLCDVMIGVVDSILPIRIKVNQKLMLESNALVFSKTVTGLVTNYALEEIDTEHSHPSTNFDNKTVHSHIDGAGLETDSAEVSTVHSHPSAGLSYDLEHRHTTEKLSVGDRVILLRADGGQKYFVIDKVGIWNDTYK